MPVPRARIARPYGFCKNFLDRQKLSILKNHIQAH